MYGSSVRVIVSGGRSRRSIRGRTDRSERPGPTNRPAIGGNRPGRAAARGPDCDWSVPRCSSRRCLPRVIRRRLPRPEPPAGSSRERAEHRERSRKPPDKAPGDPSTRVSEARVRRGRLHRPGLMRKAFARLWSSSLRCRWNSSIRGARSNPNRSWTIASRKARSASRCRPDT